MPNLRGYGEDLALRRAIDALLPHHLPKTRVQKVRKRRGGLRKMGGRGVDSATLLCACVLGGGGRDLEAGEGRHEELGLPRILGEETDRRAVVHLQYATQAQLLACQTRRLTHPLIE